jgi:putative transcriptional regulator
MKHSMADKQIQEELAAFALGSLSPPEARIIESHLKEGCEVCQAGLEPFASVVTALALASPPAIPAASVREKLLSRLAKEAESVLARPTRPQADLKQFYAVRSDEGDWREACPGILEKRLFADRDRGTVTSLLKIAPGVYLPNHKHLGIEECLVIEGDFQVNGESFGPGDYRCAMPESIDESAYSINGAVLLIIAQQGHLAL